jgi:hypothetical protein
LQKLDQVISELPKECEVWITSDHGQVVSGPSGIEIPPEILITGDNGYRAALVKEKLPTSHVNHCFYLRAQDLGYEQEGYWAFPKPGFSFRLQPKPGFDRSRFRPLENMRHSGLSAFEIFVPLARLRKRTSEVVIKLVPQITGTFKVGFPSHLVFEVSADAQVPGQIEVASDTDGVQTSFVSDVGPTPQVVRIPFTPTKPGSVTITVSPRWGYKPVSSPVQVTLEIGEDATRPLDSLDLKLKNLFG